MGEGWSTRLHVDPGEGPHCRALILNLHFPFS